MMILLVLSLTQFGLSATELYNRGNEYYGEGRYSEAIAAFEQVLQSSPSARVHYNLGNAYFKHGMMGKAVLHYRRALFLAPRDRDIAYNLAFVRNYRADKVQSSASPLVKILADVFHYFSLFEAQIMMTVLFAVASVLLSLFLVLRRNVFGYLAGAAAVLCVFFVVNWQAWQAERSGRHAVVTVPEASVASGPAEDHKTIILIHDGAEVRIRETRSDYALIQLPGGIGGWLPRAAVEEIF